MTPFTTLPPSVSPTHYFTQNGFPENFGTNSDFFLPARREDVGEVKPREFCEDGELFFSPGATFGTLVMSQGLLIK